MAKLTSLSVMPSSNDIQRLKSSVEYYICQKFSSGEQGVIHKSVWLIYAFLQSYRHVLVKQAPLETPFSHPCGGLLYPFKRSLNPSIIATDYSFMPQSDIREIIWQIVASIPEGKVATYGQVAKAAGYPSHARLVGATMKKLPKDSTLPWHRVINAQGKISFTEGSDAYQRQKLRLESEGVVFLKGKVSLNHYGW